MFYDLPPKEPGYVFKTQLFKGVKLAPPVLNESDAAFVRSGRGARGGRGRGGYGGRSEFNHNYNNK